MDMDTYATPFLADVEWHSFDPRLARLIGVNEALVLSRVHRTIRAGTHLLRGADGVTRSWIGQSYDEWGKVFIYWSVPTIRRTFDRLRDQDVILTETFGAYDHKTRTYDPVNRQLWYTINYPKLNTMYRDSYGMVDTTQQPLFTVDQPQTPAPPSPKPKRPTRKEQALMQELPATKRGNPLTRTVIAWWTKRDAGYPNGVIQGGKDVDIAGQIARVAEEYAWDSATLFDRLQQCYTYHWNYDGGNGFSWRGVITLGVMAKRLPIWYQQIYLPAQTATTDESVATGYTPVVPRGRYDGPGD